MPWGLGAIALVLRIGGLTVASQRTANVAIAFGFEGLLVLFAGLFYSTHSDFSIVRDGVWNELGAAMHRMSLPHAGA